MIDEIYGETSKINERTLKFKPSKHIVLKNNKLYFEGKDIINSKEIKYNNVIFKCNSISEGRGFFIINECNYNKLSLLGIPLLLKNNYLGKILKKYIYNLYVTKDIEEIKVVLRLANTEDYYKVEDSLVKNKHYINCKNLGNNLIAFSFDINHIKKEIKTIMRGRYSKLLDKDKFTIIEYYNNDTAITNILFPTPTSRATIAKNLDVDINLIKEIISKPTITEYYEESINL